MTHEQMMTRIMAIAEQVGLEPTPEQMAEVNAIIDEYDNEQLAIAGNPNLVATQWESQRQEFRREAGTHTWYHPSYWYDEDDEDEYECEDEDEYEDE